MQNTISICTYCSGFQEYIRHLRIMHVKSCLSVTSQCTICLYTYICTSLPRHNAPYVDLRTFAPLCPSHCNLCTYICSSLPVHNAPYVNICTSLSVHSAPYVNARTFAPLCQFTVHLMLMHVYLYLSASSQCTLC